MQKYVFLVLISTLFFSASIVQAEPYSNFTLSGTEYFSLFNYNDTTKHERIHAFEKELIAHADRIMAYLNEHPDYENLRSRHETPVKNLGLILVYTAMFMLNNNNAVLQGAMDSHSFDQLGERYTKAQVYLDLALKLVPEDDRIHSWAVANELRKQKVETGKVSEETWMVLFLSRKKIRYFICLMP